MKRFHGLGVASGQCARSNSLLDVTETSLSIVGSAAVTLLHTTPGLPATATHAAAGQRLTVCTAQPCTLFHFGLLLIVHKLDSQPSVPDQVLAPCNERSGPERSNQHPLPVCRKFQAR